MASAPTVLLPPSKPWERVTGCQAPGPFPLREVVDSENIPPPVPNMPLESPMILAAPNYANEYQPYGRYHHSPYYYQGPSPFGRLPPNSLFSSVESGALSIFERFSRLTQAIGSLAHLLDSTMYAGWSSVMAIVSVSEHFKRLRQDYLSQWIGLYKKMVSLLKRLLFWQKISKTQVDSLEDVWMEKTLSRPKRSRFFILLSAIIASILCILVFLASKLHAVRLSRASVKYGLVSNDSRLLKLQGGEVIKVQPVGQDGQWLWGIGPDGESGLVPRSYVEIL